MAHSKNDRINYDNFKRQERRMKKAKPYKRQSKKQRIFDDIYDEDEDDYYPQ